MGGNVSITNTTNSTSLGTGSLQTLGGASISGNIYIGGILQTVSPIIVNKSAIAVLDVFEREPYNGKLSKLKNCIVTPHIGSMSVDCRERMELEATKSIINFFNRKKFGIGCPSLIVLINFFYATEVEVVS